MKSEIYKITIDIEYKKDMCGNIQCVKRQITLDSQSVYEDYMAFELYAADNSIIRQLELWLIKISSNDKFQRTKNRRSNSCYLMRLFQLVWGKLFAK